MDHPGFFENAGPFSLGEIAGWINAEMVAGDGREEDSERAAKRLISNIRTLDGAGPDDISFYDNRKYLSQFKATKAGACIAARKEAKTGSGAGVLLLVDEPYRAWAQIVARFYPGAISPQVWGRAVGREEFDAKWPGANVHPSADIEDGAVIEPGVVIGEGVRIGRGTRVSSGAVIGYRCFVGRNCLIGPNASLSCALIGDRVVIHQGAAIGQDGFGFAMGAKGHLKVPQIGRVIIQDDVEIGANCTIDRGALGDTIIGEGSRIDNLVQIAHNVVMGRHCVIVSQTGISGSTTIGDFVVMGGQVGVIGHLNIGDGVKVAANGKLSKDIEAGAVVGGAPAVPVMQWKKEIIALRRLAASQDHKKK